MSLFKQTEQSIDSIISELENRFPARFPMQNAASPALPLLIAIDGRCASGKSTLGLALKQELELRTGAKANLFHMDDFYLRPEQRTEARYLEPGGNVGRERFSAEVLRPLKSSDAFSYRPFDCRTMALSAPVAVPPALFAVIEGSYSLHPDLAGFYDLRVFLSVSPSEQRRRLLLREGESRLRMFEERWIPLEESYFAALRPEKNCDLRFEG